MEYIYFALVLIVAQTSTVYCLECLTCQQLGDPVPCNTTMTCPEKQACFLNVQDGNYTWGCGNNQYCGGVVSPAFVGRDVDTQPEFGHDVVVRQSPNCRECCSTDLCNFELCKHPKLNGNWTLWTTKSNCDVTSGQGVNTRSRSCTNPAPANGGRDCIGTPTETKPCQRDPCPVHGGWSTWSGWGMCSVTCDIGIQRRDRSCTHPYPSLAGDHCFGESRDDRICLSGACHDGGWTSWSSWGTCSETCGGGIRSQTRTCTNPKPSLLGNSCNGTPIKVSTCNKQTCPENRVAFTAYGISGNWSLIFPYNFENYGNGYDNTPGKFTCSVPGIYSFSVQISKRISITTDFVQCFLRKNSESVLGAIQDPYNADKSHMNDKDGYSLSFSGSFHLNQNDTVYVGQCRGISSFYTNNLSSFTGVLVTPDV